MSVDAAWSALRAWCATHAPEALEHLHPPPTEVELRMAEAALEATLPDEARAFYRLVGGADHLGPFGDPVLTPSEMVGSWRMLVEALADPGLADGEPGPDATVDPGIARVWWHRGWLPFTDDEGGNYVCIDTRPAEGGRRGQLIEFRHDDPTRRRVATGIADWIDQRLAQLQAGELIVAEDDRGAYKGILPREALRGALVDWRMRGETQEAARARARAQVRSAPSELALALWRQLQRAGAVELDHAEQDLGIGHRLTAAIAGTTPDGWAAAAYAALRVDDVLDGGDLDVDTIARVLDALPFADDVLPPRRR